MSLKDFGQKSLLMISVQHVFNTLWESYGNVSNIALKTKKDCSAMSSNTAQ